MENVDEALAFHLGELSYFYLSPSEPTLSAREVNDGGENQRKIQAGLECALTDAAAHRAHRGRPPAFQSSNERTHQSLQAFFFVGGEMEIFRNRNGIKRIPVKVRNAFVEFAQKLYPSAEQEIVFEHIRRHERYLPKYEEATCFLLVREFALCEDEGLGSTRVIHGDVLIAGSRAKYPPA
jgi:hypothetical protein